MERRHLCLYLICFQNYPGLFLLHEKETYPISLALLSPFLIITVDFYDITVFNTYIFLHVLLTQGRRALKYKPIIKDG